MSDLTDKLKGLLEECDQVQSEFSVQPLSAFQINRIHKYPAALRAIEVAVRTLTWYSEDVRGKYALEALAEIDKAIK